MNDGKKINVLIAVDTLLTGGAEIFALNLSKALSENCNVTVFCKHSTKIDRELINFHYPNIRLVTLCNPILKLLSTIDSLLFRLNIDINLYDFAIRKFLCRFFIKESINIVHSHLSTVDFVVSKAVGEINTLGKRQIKHVLTVHGDYLSFEQRHLQRVKIYKLLNFEKKIRNLLYSSPKVVCISDMQMEFFNRYYKKLCLEANPIKIYNGHQRGSVGHEQVFKNKKMLGIAPNDKVFGMVSRGIPEKGWDITIKAFVKLLNIWPNTHLILVGESAYLKELAEENKHYSNIHFVGFSHNPVEWIKIFDIGLLLSHYKSESLPTVIIEYLSCGVPVIATNVGEIEKMISVNNSKLAGVLLSPSNLNITEIVSVMEDFIVNESSLQKRRELALQAYAKFNMKDCLQKYLEVYDS